MNIVTTIIPIFAIIILGFFAHSIGFIQAQFLGPANRLVYYMAIPAMIFRSISKASFKSQFNIKVVVITCIAVLTVFGFSWLFSFIIKIKKKRKGSFIQSSFHGNLGYIGLAVAYYYLGDKGFVRAGIIAGFIMILQNFLAVVTLQSCSADISTKKNRLNLIWKILGNPVILSAMAGILFSAAGIPIPLVIKRILDIISGLALPMALLLIGASLSLRSVRVNLLPALGSSMIKLILLPGIGFALYLFLNTGLRNFVPALILLASPTATITYVMAKELGGDTDFSVTAISISTILSAITFSIWLTLAN
jgi:hypothetical protein